jgi:hypothetical protein
MYMHAFDFKTWFQTKVWRSLKETQNIEWNWDLEVVNLVVLYLSTNPKQPENIYLPMFYERNQIEDPAIMGESYKQLVIFLARTMERVGMKPAEKFRGQLTQNDMAGILAAEPFSVGDKQAQISPDTIDKALARLFDGRTFVDYDFVTELS